MKPFSERMKEARARAQISQESLANKVGMTKASISKAELGLVQGINMEALFAVADVLQVSPRWLATGKDEGPSKEMTLRFDANKALAELPEELRDPLLDIIEAAANAAKTRYWKWVQERES